jgi:DNA-binding response OmpR family regulator
MEERKILIVEDERKIADTLKFGLSEFGFNLIENRIDLRCARRSITRCG